MARLTIEQVKAPDFSASSEMLARANESFNTGIDSAKSILDKYNTGQQAKGDQALVGALAGLSSEEELANFLQTTDLNQMNISDTMRQNILTARESILGNNATRQSTANAADANSRANAGEGRVAAEYADGVSARDELRALTPDYVAALQEGQRGGYGASGNERELLAATLQAEAGGEGMGGMLAAGAVIRNRAETGKYGGNSISGVIMQPGQFSAWNGVTGYAGGEGAIDMSSLRVGKDAYAAADAILSGNYQDPTGGATHYYNPDVATPAWGAGANPSGSQWTTIGNHIFGNPDGVRASASGPVQGYVPGAITSNPMGGQAAADFTAALQAGTRMAPDQAAELFNSVLGQQAQGQSLIDAAEAKRQSEVVAGVNIANLQNPNTLTGADLQSASLNIPGVSNTNRLAAGVAASNLATEFAGVIAPTVTPDAATSAAAELRTADIARRGALDPVIQPFVAAGEFDNATDTSPGQTIADAVPGISSSPAALDRVIGAFAQRNGLSNGEAAVVYQSVAQGNPELMDQLVGALPDSNLDKSLKNMSKYLFNDGARSRYETSRVEAVRLSDAVRKNQGEILIARTSAAKLPKGSPARAQAEAEVARMELVDRAMNDPQKTKEALATYLGTDVYDLATLDAGVNGPTQKMIENDQNLTDEQILLLITALRL